MTIGCPRVRVIGLHDRRMRGPRSGQSSRLISNFGLAGGMSSTTDGNRPSSLNDYRRHESAPIASRRGTCHMRIVRAAVVVLLVALPVGAADGIDGTIAHK